MFITRVLGVLFLLLCLYYLRIFALRQEPLTVVQMAALLCAAAILFLQDRPERPNAIWFRGWRPVAWPGWVVMLGGVALMLAVFLIVDRDSHSVTDTLHRIVPTYSLLAALTVKLWYERTGILAR
ncbi:MAG: hypothetical protein HY332_09225 [Chloroflexi bacterium]|nr:hypothetical protein [Chloroflexota bacterium]